MQAVRAPEGGKKQRGKTDNVDGRRKFPRFKKDLKGLKSKPFKLD